MSAVSTVSVLWLQVSVVELKFPNGPKLLSWIPRFFYGTSANLGKRQSNVQTVEIQYSEALKFG